MKKAFKFIFGTLALLLIMLVAVFWTPDTDRDEMIAKYGGPSSSFIKDKNGLNIHVRDQGKRDGAPLILIHGGNSSLHVWEKMVTVLGDEFRLISLDLPGHGLTGANTAEDYTTLAMTEAIEDVMDALSIEKAVWVGNSFGGRVAWHGTLLRPDRVSGLILIDASGSVTGDPIKLYLAARIARSPAGGWLVPNFTPKSIVKASLKQVYANDENVTDEIVNRHWELARFPGNRDAVLAMTKLSIERYHWDNIGNIAVPTLILWGEQDETIPLPFAKAFESHIKGSMLITYPNAAHVPMEEIPEDLTRDIKSWYTSNFQLNSRTALATKPIE